MRKAPNIRMKALSAVLAAVLLILSFPAAAGAAPSQDARVLTPEEIAYLQSLEVYSKQPLPDMDIDPGYVSFEAGTQAASSLPSSFDLRNEGRITDVKRQGDFGTCWAHSALGSAESILITRGLADRSIDLAEKHLAYYTFHDASDKLGNTSGDYIHLTLNNDTSNYLNFGGTINYSTVKLASWTGAVDEKDHPEFSINIYDKSEIDRYYESSLSYSIDKYHMTDCLWVSPYALLLP